MRVATERVWSWHELPWVPRMSDPTGTTEIVLTLPWFTYGRGRTALANLIYPDERVEWVVARGRSRLIAKAWEKIQAWAAETGIQEGYAGLSCVLLGSHHTEKVGVLPRLGGESDLHIRELYGPAAARRIRRERIEAGWQEFLRVDAQAVARLEAKLASTKEMIADLAWAMDEDALAKAKGRKAELNEWLALAPPQEHVERSLPE